MNSELKFEILEKAVILVEFRKLNFEWFSGNMRLSRCIRNCHDLFSLNFKYKTDFVENNSEGNFGKFWTISEYLKKNPLQMIHAKKITLSNFSCFV